MTTIISPVSPAMLRSTFSHGLRCLGFLAATFALTLALGAAEPASKQFSIPSGEASKSLEKFSEQAGTQVVYLIEQVRGVATNAAQGQMTPREALEIMLEGTNLQVVEDAQNKTLVIRRKANPGPTRASDRPAAAVKDNVAEEVVQMTPFEVSTQKDSGYRKSMSTTTSRIAMEVIKNPQAVEIISGELLKDFGATDMWQAMRYSSSVTVIANAVAQNNQFNMRGFQVPVYINGVAIPHVGSTFSRMVTDNIERIEIAKGPVGLYYGVSTPNGVANFITKKPEFRQATSLDLRLGNFGYSYAGVDTQGIINKRLGLAYRLVTSFTDYNGRVENQHGTDLFVAPSVIFRPNDKVEVSVEYDFTKNHTPYSTSNYTLAFNPQYYQDYQQPSAAILQYFKNTYALATDTEAQAKLVQRWGPTQTWANWLLNWVADKYAMTGIQPYYWSGSTIDWWRFSPKGDTYTNLFPEANTDGRLQLVDTAVTVTPVENLSVKYRWVQSQSNTQFDRGLIYPRGGLRPDGRFIIQTIAAGLTHQPQNVRFQRNSTQQLDLSYQLEALGMKHTLVAGLQHDRTTFAAGSAAIDLTKTKPILDAQGNVVIDTSTGVGIPLTGADAFNYWDPWGPYPLRSMYEVLSSEARISTYQITKFKAYYVSYRGSALNDRLNVLAGLRHTKSVNLARSDNTPTLGAIYAVTPGIHAFASWSKTLTFNTQMSAFSTYPGNILPSDNAHLLDNELDKGYECGIKTNWNDNTLSGTISFYRDDRDGVVVADTLRQITDPRNLTGDPMKNVYFQVNGGLQRAEGVDVDLNWTPNNRLQVLVNGNYMWTAKILSDPSLDPTKPGASLYIHEKTLRLQNAPLFSSRVVVKYDLTPNATLGAAIRYSDLYEYSNAGVTHVTVPGETIYDMFASYTAKIYEIPTTFKLNLINIGDTYNDITRDNGFVFRASMSLEF